MSKSPGSKLAYAARRETRLLRAKTAAALMPWFLEDFRRALPPPPSGKPEDFPAFKKWLSRCTDAAAEGAVLAADALLAKVDRTAPPDAGPPTT